MSLVLLSTLAYGQPHAGTASGCPAPPSESEAHEDGAGGYGTGQLSSAVGCKGSTFSCLPWAEFLQTDR